MGTSGSYGGPAGKNPLLPPWAQGDGDGVAPPGQSPPQPNDDSLPTGPDGVPPNSPAGDPSAPPLSNPNFNPTPSGVPLPRVSWSTAKRGLTSYTSSGGGRDNLRGAANRYVGARGGSRTAARAAQGGRSATSRVGSFLSAVASRGISETIRSLGLSQYVGKSIDQVLTAIANVIAPAGATQEEAVARQAVNDCLAFLYEKYQLADEDISKLDAMDRQTVVDTIEVSVTSYIYHRWLQELGRKIEEKAYTPEEAVRLERDIHAFIRETVRLDMSSIDPMVTEWSGPSGQAFVERIYRDAYEMLEGGQ